ncbi:dihydroneopterin aldolase [Rufibacter immobilis]|uniref:dihydroneopterin aldolase n=1 Tax=Rufibacter immobilis TaxID=1348778 RepID=UPI0035E682BF
MGQIALEGMEFFAFHGFYDEEQKIGNKYGVDLYLQTDLQDAAASDNLDQTVNYEVLYKLVLHEMSQPARLLEHLGHRIIEGVYREFPFVEQVKVSVSKFNPPLGGICHKAKVTLEKNKEWYQL